MGLLKCICSGRGLVRASRRAVVAFWSSFISYNELSESQVAMRIWKCLSLGQSYINFLRWICFFSFQFTLLLIIKVPWCLCFGKTVAAWLRLSTLAAFILSASLFIAVALILGLYFTASAGGLSLIPTIHVETVLVGWLISRRNGRKGL